MSADASTLALPSSLPIWVRHLPNCSVEVSIEHASLVEEPSTREEHRDEQRPLYSVQRRTLPTVRHQRHSDLEQAHGRECGVGRPLAGAVIKGEKRGRPGKWIVDYRDHAGIRRWKTFDTKREAEDFYADLLKTQDVRTKPVVDINITLPDYAAHWLDTLKKSESGKERSREIYDAQLRRYILPSFPIDQKVRTMQRTAIKAWALKPRERLARNSTKLAFTTLRR